MQRKSTPLILIFLMVCTTGLWTGSLTVKAQTGGEPNRYFLPVVLRSEPPQWIGPYSGKIVSLASSPTEPQTIYAGTWGSGVYKSIDGGLSWVPVNKGLANLYIQSLAVDPSRPTILYAGTFRERFYKSTDGGATWSARTVHPTDSDIVYYAIAIDPTNPDIIYLGYRAVPQTGPYDPATGPWLGKILRSTDAGENWSVVLQNVRGESVQDYPYDIAVHPNDGNQVYAAFHVSGPFKCVNGVWQQILVGNPSLAGRSITIRPHSSPAVVYLGAWTSQNAFVNDNRGGLYIWDNGVLSWTFASNDLTGKDIYPSYGVEIDPANPSVLYSATWGSGLYSSTDNGLNWSNAGTPWDTIYSVLPHPTRGTPVFVGTTDVGLYYGTPQAWTKAKLPGSPVTGIIPDPNNNQVLYASTAAGGVSKSADQGYSWSLLNTYLGDTNIHGLVYHAGSNSIFALTETRGIFRYDLTAGLGWIASSGGLPLLSGSPPAISGGQSQEGESGNDAEEILLRLDGSINPKASRPEYEGVSSLTFDPQDPGVGYLGTAGAGVYKSQDNGSSWTFLGLPSLTVHSIAVDPANSQVLYAATNMQGVIKTSLDGGLTWMDQALPDLPAVNLVAFSQADPSTVFAGTSSGLYKRGGDGIWNGPMVRDSSVTAVASHPAHPGTILVGTTSGAFVSTDNGAAWQTVQAELNGIHIRSIQFETGVGDPEWVYFATQSHGTLRMRIP